MVTSKLITIRYSSSTFNFRACAQALPQYTALEIFIDKKMQPKNADSVAHAPLYVTRIQK